MQAVSARRQAAQGKPVPSLGKAARPAGLKCLKRVAKMSFMERARPLIYYRKGSADSEKVLNYLTSRAVGYEAVEVKEESPELKELMHATGQTETPTLVYGKDILRKFDIPELNAFLDKHQLDSRPGDR